MPVSAYLQSIGFFAVAIVALFASAGTAAIPSYWVYLAIFGAVFVASFLLLDPTSPRAHAARRQAAATGAAARSAAFWWRIGSSPGLDRGRFHWSDTVPAGSRLSLIALAGGYAFASGRWP